MAKVGKYAEHLTRAREVEPFDGPELGDPLNVRYAQACKLSLFETVPDCGHKSCGLLCDPLIRQVRNRRATGKDRASGNRRLAGH